MDTWIDELAVALALEPLSHEEADRLLRMARDVAHRVERRGAPLASFLLGMHVARRTRSTAPPVHRPSTRPSPPPRRSCLPHPKRRSAEHAVAGRLVR